MADNERAKKDWVDKSMAKWATMQRTIEQGRLEKNPLVEDWMKESVQLFEAMLVPYDHAANGKNAIQPMNGEERLNFVKAKLRSPQAYQQLQALFMEAAKKAASLHARNIKSESF
ncbi:YpoC family protein [Sporosarcina sp. Te-1]|uniref:YpoC family protein n=1 Tax=Sporosarcina sp. Te-1 TaxID=2818390 RepID=UPI001A9DBE7C|nr:hypothetical protein [Sporosarcina sp. Te-1]QTD42150.1 hypothetical protein J3U78_04825 [Sporosarcina sp. Te-1]